MDVMPRASTTGEGLEGTSEPAPLSKRGRDEIVTQPSSAVRTSSLSNGALCPSTPRKDSTVQAQAQSCSAHKRRRPGTGGDTGSPSLLPSPPQRSPLGSSGRSHSLTRDKHTNLLVDVKTYKDVLYGSLSLEPIVLRLMDTPQFQRLHGLKQLGTSDYVYRSCTHTRFEHCVGVAHLAQRFVEGLRNRQPELGITAVDVMCVKIAGLLHDLGHGPYSHMWDDVFVKRMGIQWRHEQGSVDMFRYMLKANDIDLSTYQPPIAARDIVFIEEMILGTPQEDRKGRAPDKEFLYDIVNNTRSGLDVDKLDYFKRDARNSLVDKGVDIDRFIELARCGLQHSSAVKPYARQVPA